MKYELNLQPLCLTGDTAGGIALHQLLNLGDGYPVIVSVYGML